MWGENQDMIASLKEHKATVTSIVIRDGDEECVSASDDGSCMVWDLRRYTRNQAMFASTLFRGVIYHPDESQLLTCGSDRKLSYWDAYDGTAIRVIEGSNQEINTVDITKPDGAHFVSAGNDKTVRVWDYDDGICHFIGEVIVVILTRLRLPQATIRLFQLEVKVQFSFGRWLSHLHQSQRMIVKNKTIKKKIGLVGA